MPRPLMQLGVGDLEAKFATSKNDIKTLKQLEHELQYRQVPRAVALLAEVQAAMYDSRPETAAPARSWPAAVPTSQQTGLWELSATKATGSVLLPASEPLPPELATTPTSAAFPEKPPPAEPAMVVSDAYKILKATTSSTWESIEQTRRQMVQQSSPLNTLSMNQQRRSQMLAEAKRVNAAYALLSQRRAGSR